jgi:hypothetical protein
MDDITTKHDSHEPVDPEVNPNVAYEHGDADVLTVTKYTAVLVFGILIAAAAMYGLFSFFNGEANKEEAAVPQVIRDQRPKAPPEPRLQQFPKQYIKDLRAAEDAQIKSYGWVDQKNGIVRIPIDDAIDAVAKAGLPSRPVKTDDGLDQNGYRQIPSASGNEHPSHRRPADRWPFRLGAGHPQYEGR